MIGAPLGRGRAVGLDTALILTHGCGDWSPERVGGYSGSLIWNAGVVEGVAKKAATAAMTNFITRVAAL